VKLSKLAVHGFIGIKSIEADLATPVHLFCGNNFAGKSSIRDAVALALTGNLGRVSLKKDAGQLVHDGAKAAACEVTEILSGDADGVRTERVYGVTITAAGKIHEGREAEVDPTLQYVLDAQRFAAMDTKERRTFLFGLMRVRLTPASIVERLEQRGCSKTRVAEIAPLLRSGFDAAYEQAKNSATQSKALWRNVTGETYGEVKAATWAAAGPDAATAMDESLAEASARQIVIMDRSIAQENQAIGGLKNRRDEVAAKRAKLPALRAEAEKLERLRKKLLVDRESMASMETKVASTSGAPRPVQTWACPCCASLLVLRDGKLVEHVPPAGGAPADAGQLPAYEASLRMCKSAVANTERDIAVAESAQRQVTEIEALADISDEDAKAITDAEAEIVRLGAKKSEVQARIDVAKQYARSVEVAKKKTAEAADMHTAVCEWAAIAKELSPDGIPAEILAATLTPINTRLKQSALDTGWPDVALDGDMVVRVGGRVYGLLSESEKWRADAVIAEAISHISGRKLLVLDRMDVLDLPSRAQLIGWLDTLADFGDIDTAIVCGTLKQKPTGLPKHITAHWVVGGEILADAEFDEATS
jgi:DNA repair exonuclease SbcCD ATPase subunit